MLENYFITPSSSAPWSSPGFCPGSGYTENPSGDGGTTAESLTLLALILEDLFLSFLPRDFADYGEDYLSKGFELDRFRRFLSPLFLAF